MNERLLIVFLKNPVPGKVKTRLAVTVGNDVALKIYKVLVDHTHNVASNAQADKVVYYSDFIPDEDQWSLSSFDQALQFGVDLGERMMNAFKNGFGLGYRSIIIIGSDCYELTPAIINNAFDELEKKDVVLGPAQDGGYYLLGMNELINELFIEKEWSTATVLDNTISDVVRLKFSYSLLETLSDIDTEEDLNRSIVNFTRHVV